MKSGVIKKISYVTVLSLANSVLSFLFQLVIAKTFGAGDETDAFFLAFSIPEWIMNITVMIIPVTVIPVMSGFIANGENKKAWNLHNSLFTLFLIVLGGIVVLLSVFSKQVSTVIAGNLPAESIPVFRETSLYLFPVIIFTTLAALVTGVYYSFERYIIPNISPLVQTVFMIGGIYFLRYRMGIHSAALFMLVGSAARLVFLMASFRGAKFGIGKELFSAEVKQVLKLMIPLLAGNIILNSGVIIDRYFASLLMAGSVTYIFYGSRITRLLARITSKGIYTVFFPKLSKAHAVEDSDGFQSTVDDSMMLVSFLGLIVVGAISLFGTNIIYVLFQNEQFTRVDVLRTGAVTIAMIGILFSAPLGDIINNIFYSSKNTKTPMLISISVFGVGVALKYLLLRVWDYMGIAVGASIEAVLVICLSLLFLKKKNARLRFIRFAKSFFQNLVAFAASFALIFGCIRLLFGGAEIFYSSKIAETGIIAGLWIAFVLLFFAVNVVLKNSVTASLTRALTSKKAAEQGN